MKKKGWIHLFLVCMLLISVNPLVSYAGDLSWPRGPSGPSPLETLGSNSSVTFVNDSGMITGGPIIDSTNIVPLLYYGNDISQDVTLGSDDPKQTQWKYTGGSVAGRVVRIKNVGYLNGKYLTVAMKVGAHANLNFVNGGIVPDQSGNLYPSSTSYDIWIEDEDGNQIKDEALTLMLPTNLVIPKAVGTQYRQYDYMSDGLVNIIVRNATESDAFSVNTLLFGQESYNYLENNSYQYQHQKSNLFVSQNNESQIVTQMNTLFKPAAGHLLIKAGVYNGTYPNGKYSNLKTDTIDSIQFFTDDNKFLIPLQYNLPSVIETYNEDTYQAKVKITQPVFEQSNDSFYPDSGLTVTTTVPEVVKVGLPLNDITVRDKDGNDLTSQVSLTTNPSGEITYTLSKSLLVSLKNNIITLEGTFELDTSAKAISDYANDGISRLPIIAQNSNQGNGVSEGEIQVKVPSPTGDPITQTVYQGVSTTDLNAKDFVGNLKSILSDDSLVVSFKEDKIFSNLGKDSVPIEIKSEYTGATAIIFVPINVEEAPRENANLIWQPSDTGEKNKLQNVDKSTMNTTLEQKLTWWTSLPDREYVISVRESTGKEIVTKELETNGLSVDTKIDASFDMPTDQLTYGNNEYLVGIYTKDVFGNATGAPLDTIDLTIYMDGSLQLVSVPSQLSWTNRLISKGTLDRDVGNTMEVKVVDTRNMPEDQKFWSVSAQAKIVDNQLIPFGLGWKKDESSELIPLKEKQQVLTKSEATQSQDIYSKKWDEKTGILLHSDNYLDIGNYSNKVVVNWNLYDTAIAE